MSHHDPSQDLDAADLAAVTGGVATTPSTSNNAQVLAAMQSLQSSIKGLAGQQNNSSSSLAQLLPLLALRGGGSGGACPCGCGMANCARR